MIVNRSLELVAIISRIVTRWHTERHAPLSAYSSLTVQMIERWLCLLLGRYTIPKKKKRKKLYTS